MRHEQQARTLAIGAESAVVEGCNDGLASAGRRDNQVAVTIVNATLNVDRVQISCW